ncbi:O-methyltransferase ZRP4 [Hordeum vulgare]|nr:O-methyltransferase ZRP4 [Hordeum vulgare]
MTLKLLAEVSPQEFLEALAGLQNHLLGYVKSMSLRCVVELGIPDAIHCRGGTATLADIVTDTKVHPGKVADLQRVMELLTTSGIFTATANVGDGETVTVVYGLTTACRILVGWRNLAPMVPFLVNPLVVSSFFSMPAWFRTEPEAAGSLFEIAHGCSQWQMVSKDAGFNNVLNHSMAADSQVFLEVIIVDKGRIFRGLRSLVDVGGGNGAGTQVIAKAFPRIKCTVMDLPHVVVSGQAAAGDDILRFVAGDMFESIPSADAVLLKVGVRGEEEEEEDRDEDTISHQAV